MQRLTASFLGRDCPGIVAAVSQLFADSRCNIEAMSQTRLQGEFAAIFVVGTPEGLDAGKLRELLEKGVAGHGLDLSVLVRPAIERPWEEQRHCQPFVVTVDGPDRPGLIAAMSKVFARHNVNIENLNALLENSPDGQALFLFEIMIPDEVDIGRLRRELQLEAGKLDLRVSMQHRDIFEAVNRVKSF